MTNSHNIKCNCPQMQETVVSFKYTWHFIMSTSGDLINIGKQKSCDKSTVSCATNKARAI